MYLTWAVVVAQLAERSLPTPEIRGSNPAFGKILLTVYCQLALKRRKTRPVANVINIFRLLITTRESYWLENSLNYYARVLIYERKMFYRIDHRNGHQNDCIWDNFESESFKILGVIVIKSYAEIKHLDWLKTSNQSGFFIKRNYAIIKLALGNFFDYFELFISNNLDFV